MKTTHYQYQTIPLRTTITLSWNEIERQIQLQKIRLRLRSREGMLCSSPKYSFTFFVEIMCLPFATANLHFACMQLDDGRQDHVDTRCDLTLPGKAFQME